MPAIGCVSVASWLRFGYNNHMTKIVSGVSALRLRGGRFDAPRMNDVLSRIYARRGVRSLGRIRKAFALSQEEAASLFGVSRQAFRKWEKDGVPTARLADVDRMLQLVELMERRLRRDRLPALVRTPAKDFGDRTVLQTIRSEGPLSVMDYMHRLASGVPR